MWLVVHETYARNVYLDGRPLEREDYKPKPGGHTAGALNMGPAYAGYLAANVVSGFTRVWLMGQGHCVAAIDSLNLLTDNMTAHQKRYSLSDEGLTRYVRDFYSYLLGSDGHPGLPLGSHVNAHTAGGLSEGGYLGFAELQYVHMPLLGERLVVFLSDGAFEEQRGSDWAPRWWRAEDSGWVLPIMIKNGRRIDQRTTMSQQVGSGWFRKHLQLNGFDPFVFDGRDPAAFLWAILEMKHGLAHVIVQVKEEKTSYPVRLPYGSIHGSVITALNEEAVVSAALANKGGINLVHTYEAFGPKMYGAVRQEIIFASNCAHAGRPQTWLSVPIVMTSHTWENGKNEHSHQGPSFAETLMGEPAPFSRVLFPPDYNTAAAVMEALYQTRGQIWTLVVPKATAGTDLFTAAEARRLVEDGGAWLDWAGYRAKEASLILTAVGAYQLMEVLKASRRLADRNYPHRVVYLLEPARFRKPRAEEEQHHCAKKDIVSALFPNEAHHRIFVTHTRPESILGLLGPLHTNAGTRGLGYVSRGGTLDTGGMLFTNLCSWAHCLAEAAELLGLPRERFLDTREMDALDGKVSPHGAILRPIE
jgi:phosphoketolase